MHHRPSAKDEAAIRGHPILRLFFISYGLLLLTTNFDKNNLKLGGGIPYGNYHCVGR